MKKAGLAQVGDFESIENPEAYLFTVASNLLRERAVIERRQAAERVSLMIRLCQHYYFEFYPMHVVHKRGRS